MGFLMSETASDVGNFRTRLTSYEHEIRLLLLAGPYGGGQEVFAGM
jgi:hypothetical protein